MRRHHLPVAIALGVTAALALGACGFEPAPPAPRLVSDHPAVGGSAGSGAPASSG
jgi:hypothetical protein